MTKPLCPFCGAYAPRSCDLIEDAGLCPWEEAEEEGLNLAADDSCPDCDDSGYRELTSGGIWTGENITTRREFCDCLCGQDARDQAEKTGLHAPSIEDGQ